MTEQKTYWHMQLHPTGKEKEYDAGEIVKNFELIGMDKLDNDKKNQLSQFKKEMKEGDIVLVRMGKTPKALVKVKSDWKEKDNKDKSAWFQFQREVEILEIATKREKLVVATGTLQKSIGKNTQTYKYIDNWYNEILEEKIKKGNNKNKSTNIDKEEVRKEIEKRVMEIRSYTPKIAVFGDTGAGKSSLCNALFGKNIAKISDVVACTRDPQNIFIGNKEYGGIMLIDVPGIAEDEDKNIEYMDLYKSLIPKVDLVLWAIKSDDRKYSEAIKVYNKILKPHSKKIPTIFVITQIDKIEPIEEWYENQYSLGKKQKLNLIEKQNDISDKFDISTNKICYVSSKHTYQLVELIDMIVEVLPNEKKYSFVREAKDENVSNEAKEKAEKGVWEEVKEFVKENWEEIKEVVNIVKDIWSSRPSWLRW